MLLILSLSFLVDVYLYKTALHDAQEMVSAACFQYNEDEGFVIKHWHDNARCLGFIFIQNICIYKYIYVTVWNKFVVYF